MSDTTAPAEPTPPPALPEPSPPAAPAAAPPAAAAPAAPAAPPAAAAPAAAPAAPAQPEAPKPDVPSAPLDLKVEDVKETSLTLKWSPPQSIGPSGLGGYIVEYCKEGKQDWIVANKELITRTCLIIKQLAVGDKINVRVKAVNACGASAHATVGQPVLIMEGIDRPKIRLPRNLRGTFFKKVGETVNLVIPFTGKPKPVVTWTKNGEPLDKAHVTIRNSSTDTILFIRKAERKDSGKFKMTLQVSDLVDEALIDIQIIEQPGPPQNLKLLDVWGFNVALEWQPPKDNGNVEIKGYTIQKAEKKTGEWFTVLENCHMTTCTVSDLIMGNTYTFRVFSENLCGLSEVAAQAKGTAYIDKTSVTYKPPEYKEKNFAEAPKFTQPLADRSATTGFTTKLFCSVRGNPKPKVIWMKNQIILGGDPKYRVMTNEGICTLEIRKPCAFDGGIYTCKAINDLGEAVVDCRLDVKAVQIPQ
uniref:Myosin-binding protein H n=1 Tax=Callorhinchus milii TaxID=7868 RepID=A0A4W3JM55_CALMI